MAPAAKRKKPPADEAAPPPVSSTRTKRQKTNAEPSNSIETPPPTPQPAAASRGRKKNVDKSASTNGNHSEANGAVSVKTEDAVTADNASTAGSVAEAPAVKPPAASRGRKRKVNEPPKVIEQPQLKEEDSIPAIQTHSVTDTIATTESEIPVVKPSAAPRGRKRKANEPAKVNGSQPKDDGTAANETKVSSSTASGLNAAAIAEASSERNGSPAKKQKVAQEEAEAEATSEETADEVATPAAQTTMVAEDADAGLEEPVANGEEHEETDAHSALAESEKQATSDQGTKVTKGGISSSKPAPKAAPKRTAPKAAPMLKSTPGVDPKKPSKDATSVLKPFPNTEANSVTEYATPAVNTTPHVADQEPPAVPTAPNTVEIDDHQNIRPTTEPVPAHEQPKKKEKVKSKDREKREKLYQYCIKTKPIGDIFSIAELTATKIADDDRDLLSLCQQLVTHFLFAAMTLNRGILYKTRSYDVAKKLAVLGENHILIYSLIENAGRTGLWMRPLEIKSGLHQAVLRKVAKELVQSGVVKEIKSAETSKKTYISADVTPDEKHIGGGFMDEGKFDEGMINSLTGMVVRYIEHNSWARQTIPGMENDRVKSSSSTKHKSKTLGAKATKPIDSDRAAATHGEADEKSNATLAVPVERPLYHPAWIRGGKALIPQHPAYYNRYPTAMDVMLEINEQKVVKDIVFTLKDTEQLLQKMEFDGYLERMRDIEGELQMKEPRWRATKRVWKMEVFNESSQHFGPLEPDERGWLPGNGLSQVPCARCPVKMKCKPGGVVNPEECKYMEEWLAF